MWRNTIVIHSILKGKKLQNKIFNQLNIKKSKIDKDNFRKKKLKKKEKVQKKMKKNEKMNCELLL